MAEFSDLTGKTEPDGFKEFEESYNKSVKKAVVDFADFLMSDYEVSHFDDAEKTLCWQLTGTIQKYTSEQLYEEYLNPKEY